LAPLLPREIRGHVATTFRGRGPCPLRPVEYRLPLAPGKFSARPIESVRVTVRIEADEPLATIHSPSQAVEVKRDGDGQETQSVAGRTFYANAGQWIDARVQDRPAARREKIAFGSHAYFALLDRDPWAAQWLALGRTVVVLGGNTVVEVVE